ncbi:hypothetical protein BD310DRAFT_910577 [Dichomitus squalens]|uniref:Uncharacterized protein n=1 Tax=Dichomitus squalens TaxID=114155 RepID=A0A4Q9PF36_9APHY|nr:hypothetical protein BD310DRAFT_910577 [Dichomitus squalens]
MPLRTTMTALVSLCLKVPVSSGCFEWTRAMLEDISGEYGKQRRPLPFCFGNLNMLPLPVLKACRFRCNPSSTLPTPLPSASPTIAKSWAHPSNQASGHGGSKYGGAFGADAVGTARGEITAIAHEPLGWRRCSSLPAEDVDLARLLATLRRRWQNSWQNILANTPAVVRRLRQVDCTDRNYLHYLTLPWPIPELSYVYREDRTLATKQAAFRAPWLRPGRNLDDLVTLAD